MDGAPAGTWSAGAGSCVQLASWDALDAGAVHNLTIVASSQDFVVANATCVPSPAVSRAR